MKSPAIEGNIPHEWLDFGGWSNVKEQPPESFWRTLVADRDEKGHNPPSWYRRACKQSFSQRTLGGSLNTTNVINNNERSKIMTDYMKRVQSVVWMKKLMKSEGHNGDQLRGLVPNETERGDLICIIRGCSVPIVLRKTADADLEHYHSQNKPVRSLRPKFDLSFRRSTFPNSSSSDSAGIKSTAIVKEEEMMKLQTGSEIDTLAEPGVQRSRSDMATSHKTSSEDPGEAKGRAQSATSSLNPDKSIADIKRISRSKIPIPRKQNSVSSAVMAFKLHIPCQLIGECYIHGMMDGEAFKLRDRLNIDEAEFELL